MTLLQTLRKALGDPAAAQTGMPAHSRTPEPAKMAVPEITSIDLITAQRAGTSCLLLDCREPYERVQGYIPGSIHIPMNEIPLHLTDLDPHADIVVFCAHGNRSYSVARWLIRQGYKARSLAGGIADWQVRAAQSSARQRSTGGPQNPNGW